MKPIKTKKEYASMLKWIDAQFDKKISPKSEAGENIHLALIIIKDYEDRHYAIPTPDPIEAIKLKMMEMGLKNKDMVDKVGSKGYVSAILNKRKPLTLELAKFFHHELGIPAEVLLA